MKRINTFYLLQGYKMLAHKKLRKFVTIPLGINILVFTSLVAISIHQFNHLVNWIDSLIPHWLRWLDFFLWIIFAVAIIFAITYTFTILANLIAAPFNSLLAEKTTELLTHNQIQQDTSLSDILKEIPRTMKHELQKIWYYIPRALLCLLLFLIPAIQAIAPFTWFLFSSWMMSIEYLDIPLDNRRLGFREVRTALMQRKIPTIKFGMTVMVASAIPILNFLVMPAAVVGAAIFCYDNIPENK
jgi:CysZ protein